MLSRVFSSLVRVRVTLAYAAALFTIASLLLILGPKVQDRVVSHLSTNLENLGQGHLGTLLGSAFVTAEGYTYLLLPGLVCLLALAELVWCSRRLIQAFALGHVGATLIVAAGLAAAIKLGWLPISVAHAQDVGLSYGAIAVLGTLTAAIPMRWRAAWIAGWVTIALVIAVSGTDFTAVGHAIALILGIVLSTRFSSDSTWTPARLVLLAIGVGFGLLLLVGVSFSVAPIALPAGVVVAAIATWAWWRWLGASKPGDARLITVSA
ncbi:MULTISPECIES: rhomboid-like protein [unclassified Mycobacterium]|uniref:rhomboid-like protein n=1 Tax=Mycobacterium sp. DL99 TaxID=2528957 RepID=UPI001AEBE0F8|nr:rhomboid-like protein [Mycobacterium sp. DL99]